MPAASQLYPLSTQDGQAVPLDVVRPLSLISWAFAVDTPEDITVPAGYGLVWVMATAACVIKEGVTDLPAGLVDGTEYTGAIYIPANVLLNIMVTPGAYSLLGIGGGKLYMNSVEQWGALLQSRQSTIG